MLFPPCVVVDFFFDEEEIRYAITRRQRKEHKKGEKLARASQNSPYSNPLCPFFPSSFHSFNLPHAIERYKNARFVSINRKKANDEEKSSHPSTHYHRQRSIDDSNACDFLARVRARTQKKSDIICARKCAQMRARESEEEMKKKCVFQIQIQKFLFLFLFLFLFPILLVFLFFCDEENKRRERLCKKRVFSRSEFLRTFYEVYGCIRALFSTSLARAVPSQRARVEGTGK